MSKKVAQLASAERQNVDPETLLVDTNIRTDLRLDKDFVASIKELGVLVPIIAVRTANGDLRVRHGHRRTVAAIQAGLDTVPVDIAGDEGSDDAAQIERILTQHAENFHRAGLTDAEHLGVVQQLQAFGMTAAQITKRSRIKRETVDNAIVVGQSDVATAVTGRYDFLSLEQSAAIAEFDDEKEAVKQLVAAASGKWADGEDHNGRSAPSFDHVLQDLRDERDEREQQRVIVEELVAKGMTVIEKPGWNTGAQSLHRLGLEPDEHASCPGHVAWLQEEWIESEDDEDDEDGRYGYVAVFGCSDPEGNGHVKARSGPSSRKADTGAEEQTEAEKEERRHVIANNKAWRSAEEVRRSWLRELLKGSKAPSGASAYIFGELVDHESPLAYAQQHRHPVACELLGVTQAMARWLREQNEAEGKTLTDILNNASAGRAEVIALGVAIGAHEGMLGTNAWRYPSAEKARYLAKLVEWGYQPSEIEQTVIAHQDDSDTDDEDFDDEVEPDDDES